MKGKSLEQGCSVPERMKERNRQTEEKINVYI